ncbi:MAG: CPBP family intramembrane metalloprotease, partial [Oscillospiraceae bacterium]|nr:CPBP family intramembrane metalloprotease [Oscillospiraceae bacterium]
RGLIFRELRNVMPVVPAIFLQGILFGLFHMNMLQFMYASVLGVILGFAAYWSGSLWVCAIAHAAFNSINIALEHVSERFLDRYEFVIVIASVVGALASIDALYLFRRKAGGRRALPEQDG